MSAKLWFHVRRLMGMLVSAKSREVDRRLRQLSKAVRAVPSKHADPAYQERFLHELHAGTYDGRGDRSGFPAPRVERDRPSVTRLETMADAWHRAVRVNRPVAGGGNLRSRLEAYLRDLARHVVDPSRESQASWDVGYQLAVDLQIDHPSFRATIDLLTPYLQAIEEWEGVTGQWVGVLADLVEGYAAGTRERALSEQSTIVAALAKASAKRQQGVVGDVGRFQELFAESPVAMAILDRDGRVVEGNAALAVLINQPLSALRGTDLTLHLGGDGHALIAEHMFTAIQVGDLAGQVPTFALAATYLEQPTWLRLHWATSGPQHERIHVILHDVTEHRVIERWLEHQANHDHISGLPNRRYLEKRLDHLLVGARGASAMGVYAIRLDGLADIADTFGPAAGTAALQELTARATQAAPMTDLIAQLDQSTFAVVITSDTSWTAASDTIKRLVDRLADPLPITDRCAVCITPTVGAAQGIPGRTTSGVLLHCLSRSMRQATAHERVVSIDATRRYRDQERNQLVAHLPAAIEAGEITILHAPIARAETGEIVGAHAVPTWTEPDRWPVSVTKLINLATRIGLSAPIVPWCLDRALADAASWRSALGGLAPFLRVDLPARRRLDEPLAAEILSALVRHRVPATRFQLAVWESSIDDPHGESRKAILQLTAAGIRLNLNDLGAGVSRFDLLPNLYLHGVTITSRLTAGLTLIPHQDKQTTLQAMIKWGKHLTADVTLANVNNTHEQAMAHSHGATNIEGRAVADPQTAAELAKLVTETHARHAALGVGGDRRNAQNRTAQ